MFLSFCQLLLEWFWLKTDNHLCYHLPLWNFAISWNVFKWWPKFELCNFKFNLILNIKLLFHAHILMTVVSNPSPEITAFMLVSSVIPSRQTHCTEPHQFCMSLQLSCITNEPSGVSKYREIMLSVLGRPRRTGAFCLGHPSPASCSFANMRDLTYGLISP